MRCCHRALAWLGLCLLWTAFPEATGAQQPPPDEAPYRVRVAVELVEVPLVVREPSGEFVYNLNRNEINLLDNGVPQRLNTFELSSQPVSLVILVSTSQRIAPLLDRVRQSGVLFTSYILGQFGEAAVVSFDSEITVRQPFTSDADGIIQAMEKLPAGRSKNRLADALQTAIDMLGERPEGRRRVIVAVTNHEDEGSSAPIGIPLRLAQLSNISIYTIGLDRLEAELHRRPEEVPLPPSRYPPGIIAGPATPGSVQTPTSQTQEQYARVDLLSAIMLLVRSAQAVGQENVLELYSYGSGGFHVGTHGQRALEEAVHRIGQDLHNQYLLTYRPSNRDQQGFHRIEVRLARPGLMARTRPGYFVGPPPLEP